MNELRDIVIQLAAADIRERGLTRVNPESTVTKLVMIANQIISQTEPEPPTPCNLDNQ